MSDVTVKAIRAITVRLEHMGYQKVESRTHAAVIRSSHNAMLCSTPHLISIHIAIVIHGDPLTSSQVFLGHAIPPLLVDDVRASHHDLHSDHDK